MAVGLPIVSTAVAEAFHIQAASSGLIASDRDTFSEHILQLSKNPELCVNLGSAGKAYAAKYDWSVLARQYDEQVLPAILKRFDVVRCPPTRTAST
jgi:glycosyltransferase involved in cell wall biosynthesis